MRQMGLLAGAYCLHLRCVGSGHCKTIFARLEISQDASRKKTNLTIAVDARCDGRVLIVHRHLRTLVEELKIISVYGDGPARAIPNDAQAVRITRGSDNCALLLRISRMPRTAQFT